MTRIVLDVLREAPGPMTTLEIAHRMLQVRNMDARVRIPVILNGQSVRS